MENIPRHVAIIMDGNGRWATEKGLKRTEGHKKGAATLEKLALHASDLGVEVLSVYAFSTDNFKRSDSEVEFLMNLLVEYFNKRLTTITKRGIRIVVSGKREGLRSDVVEAINNITNKTKDHKNGILNICVNYGGQEEIVDASIKIHNDLNNGLIKESDLNRDLFYKYLYEELPPIDLLIRTGREHRLSNYMLYQSFYAEIIFSDILFPDYQNNDLDDAIKYFNSRDRRYGAIKALK